MTAGQQKVHWADGAAKEALASGRPPVISTGISPSGEVHIGNMREVVTADAIFRAIGDLGIVARFNYVADNYDPLRRVYPFLDGTIYGPLVGKPLSEIPCPCKRHVSYAEHFLAPFLESLEELRIRVEVERADQMYKSGRMTQYIVRALEERERIAGILHELTGKEVAADWWPFNPVCADCGRMTHAKLLGFSAPDETVEYACECGSRGTLPMAGGGKLVWRIDWPARWKMLGVTVEPFGKDHATRGGSYDTGVRIVREVFLAEPPLPVPYEWIRLKGAGDMSSSKGNVLSIGAVLEVAPPEVLRYLVLRERPARTIDFDPGLPLLRLIDEVDDAAASERDERALDLSRAGGFEPVGVPFKHLVVVAQASRFDAGVAMEILERTGFERASRPAVSRRMIQARRWLERFAPEDLRFEVQDELPEAAAGLSPDQRRFLAALAAELGEGLSGQSIHDRIHELSLGFAEVPVGDLFSAIYLALLGKPRGPRAGMFLAVLGPTFCSRRFLEAAGES